MTVMEQRLSFAGWLRGRRAQLQHRQLDVAEYVGVSEHTFSMWEKRGSISKIADVMAIARWGGVEPVFVFGLIAGDRSDAEDE